MTSSANDDESVRHLVALGYVDPDVAALRERALRQQLEAEFQQALTIDQSGDHEAAVVQLERLVAGDPDWVAPRQFLVEAYFRAGQHAEAKRQLTWLTEHGVEHPRLALVEGALALGRRELEEAQDALEYVAYVEPELHSVHTLLGTAYLRRGKLAEADASFQRALEQNAADVRALDGLAAIRLRQIRFAEAAEICLQALEHDIRYFRANYHLGAALLRLGRVEEARAAFETALKVGPKNAAPYFWLRRIADLDSNSSTAATYRDATRQIIQARRDSRADVPK